MGPWFQVLHIRLVLVYLWILVPEFVRAQCPRDRAIQGFSCGNTRDSGTCPSGSTCMGRTCCWEEMAPLASPCDDPYMNNGELFTCTVQGQSQGQGQQSQGQQCPGNCYTCRTLSGLDGMGLCCPETQRQGCEQASPAQVAFEREAQRIRSMGSGSSSTGSSSTGSSSSGSSSSRGPSMGDTRFRDQGSFQSSSGTSPARDPRMFPSRDIPRGIPPTAVPRGPGPMGATGPCGFGIRPIGVCRRFPMAPPCPRGFYCVPIGFMGACCPVGATPGIRSPIGRRMGPTGFPGPIDARTSSGAGSRGQFTPGTSQVAGRLGSSGQFSRRAVTRVTGGIAPASGTSAGLSTESTSDFDRRLFGPPPREDFPGGPIATRNTPRGQCPRTMPCTQSGWNECYTDGECPVPLRCCSPRAGCTNKCL